MAFRVANFLLLQGVWFACVLGAANGRPWIGWLAGAAMCAAHFAFARPARPDLRLAAAGLVLGAAAETLHRAAGVYVPAAGDPVPEPFAPSWLLVLWVCFALTIRHSMAWIAARPAVAALACGALGPVTWRGGAALGAAELSPVPLLSWGLLAATWAAAGWSLARLARADGR